MSSKLEKIRKQKGISQRRLEELSGVAQQRISQIECGKARLNTVDVAQKLAVALNCNVSDLIDVDKRIDSVLGLDEGNLHNYLRATRELLGLNVRRVASLLNMGESEYSDYERVENTPSLEEARQIAAVMFFSWQAGNISANLKYMAQPVDMSDNEKKLLKVMRSLAPEDQDRVLNVIAAMRLIE